MTTRHALHIALHADPQDSLRKCDSSRTAGCLSGIFVGTKESFQVRMFASAGVCCNMEYLLSHRQTCFAHRVLCGFTKCVLQSCTSLNCRLFTRQLAGMRVQAEVLAFSLCLLQHVRAQSPTDMPDTMGSVCIHALFLASNDNISQCTAGTL